MTDALEAADTDEFFGKIGGFLKRVGRGVGKAARFIGPLASAIPIPQAQLIGRAAGLIGNVLADEGDEIDAFEDLADYATEEDAIDALAPAIAAMAIRHGLKHHAAALPRAQRKQLVKTVTAATRHLAHKHGPHAVGAMPVIVAHARHVAQRKGLPAKQLPKLVAHSVRAATRSPRLLRRLTSAGTRLRAGQGVRHGRARTRSGAATGYGYTGPGRHRHRRHGHGGALGRSSRGAAGAPAPVCGACGRRRTLRFGGPVRVTIESL
jgi:hypothetical protein